jgi:PIN domain nuclease of toxin-antitoxin system
MASSEIVYLLDTHTWIWWHTAPEKLSPKVRSLLTDSRKYKSLLLSAISIWEFSKLIAKGRLTISIDGLAWIQQALDMERLSVVSLSPEIVWHSNFLPGKFHDDPADQIIVATARETGAEILTKDRLIRGYNQVKTLWD